MKYALVINGRVNRIIEDDGPQEVMLRNLAAVIVPDGASCEVGFTYSNGVFAPLESPEVSEFKTMLSDYIAEMNAKYATLGLLVTDSVIDAAQKIEATDMTKTEAMYLDMLRRNLKDAQNNHQHYQTR